MNQTIAMISKLENFAAYQENSYKYISAFILSWSLFNLMIKHCSKNYRDFFRNFLFTHCLIFQFRNQVLCSSYVKKDRTKTGHLIEATIYLVAVSFRDFFISIYRQTILLDKNL